MQTKTQKMLTEMNKQYKTKQYNTRQYKTRRDETMPRLRRHPAPPRPHPIQLIFSMRSTNGIEVMEHADVSLLFRRVSAIIAIAEKEAVVYDDFLHRVQ